jgi:acetyl-CoA carboxylase biotin carboxyl carrier protein
MLSLAVFWPDAQVAVGGVHARGECFGVVGAEDDPAADGEQRPGVREQPHVSGKETVVAEVRAEMVANVWKVVTTEGAAIEEGDTLVILESMKMEIPVLAETGGTVTKLAVAEGDVVQEGDLIATID